MSEEQIKLFVRAQQNKLNYSFLSNKDYAAKLQQLSDIQDRLYRRSKIFVPKE